jgi:hypothetical protein
MSSCCPASRSCGTRAGSELGSRSRPAINLSTRSRQATSPIILVTVSESVRVHAGRGAASCGNDGPLAKVALSRVRYPWAVPRTSPGKGPYFDDVAVSGASLLDQFLGILVHTRSFPALSHERPRRFNNGLSGAPVWQCAHRSAWRWDSARVGWSPAKAGH